MTSEEVQPARICIVDDSRFDRERLRDAMDGIGSVDVYESGEAALAGIAERPADLLISDLVMPGMSGTQLLERIRRESPSTDLILITGVASLETAVAALRMGAVDYLQKPVQVEQLRRVVQQTLLRRRLRVENERLRDTLRTAEACRALAPCLDPGEVYPIALDLVLATLECTRGLALFRRASIPRGDAIAFRGFSEDETRELRRLLIDEKRIDIDRFERIEPVRSGPIAVALREANVAFDRLLSVPIRGQAGEGGVLWVIDDGAQAEHAETERIRSIQKYAQASLVNAERYSHAQERAFIDDVTEVYNARYLLSAADNEIRRAERYRNPLSVIFLDLDRFKLVNDHHGHLVGSQTLRNLSRLLLQCIRQVDTLARYGGDEFTILLPDSDHEAAMAVAERIRRSVEAHFFETGSGSPLRLTVSAGVASYPSHGADRTQLLDAADKAMYRAKSLGRNRVASAADLPAAAAGAP